MLNVLQLRNFFELPIEMIDEHESSDVIESYHRCRQANDFVDTFYEIFLSKSPRIAEKFVNTDFTVQKLMLRESILEMLRYDLGAPGSQADLEKLGRLHSKLQVTEDMFRMWLDSLCEAVRKHDPELTPELEMHWRRAMQKGINVMLAVV